MKLSASKIDLARLCAYPFRSDVEWPEEPPARAATTGRALHEMAEHQIKGELARQIPKLPEKYGQDVFREASDLHAVLEPHLDNLPFIRGAEVKVAYNPFLDEAMEITSSGARNYGELSPGFIPGTVDMYYVEHGRVHVVDFKTGYSNYSNYVGDNGQLAHGALALTKLLGHSEAEVSIWKVKPDSLAKYSVALTQNQLGSWVNELRGVLMQTKAEPEPQPGNHCNDKFCPMRTTCPVAQGLVEQALESEAAPQNLVQLKLSKPTSQAELDALNAQRRMIEAVGKRMKSLEREAANEYGLHSKLRKRA